MDYKASCSCPIFDLTFVCIKPHPLKVMDLKSQVQCLWRPKDVVVQVVDFETSPLSPSY